jgi:hypothetical protein
MRTVAPLLTGCGGFLLAVLWIDLMFDIQVLAHRKGGDELPEQVLASIAGYYHRAVTTSRPMSRLIALVMLILLSALGFQALNGNESGWLLITSAGLASVPVVLALTHTVPNAGRLGHRADSVAVQTRLARSICRDHFVCAACMLAFVILWLTRSLMV